MEKLYDMIIIGGGPAGYTAALYAARAGMSTLVIEKMTAGGQMALTDIIENYPGFDEGINGFELGMKMQAGAEKFGAKTVYDTVTSIEASGEEKRVKCAYSEYSARTVVIATGAEPKRLRLPDEDKFLSRGVHYCAHCDGRFYKDRTVVVVGGGNSAVSDALYLSRIAKEVILVHRRDTLRATKVYEGSLSSAENIRLITSAVLTELVYDTVITGVKIKSTLSGEVTLLPCDGVFVSIGREPVTTFLKDVLPLDSQGYIIADESTKTPVSGVFAVGDVRTKPLRQVVTAVSDGAVAVDAAEEYLAEKSNKK